MRKSKRPLRLENLERRRLLASLGIDLRVFESAGTAPAAAEISGPILKGTEFWVEVAVEDVRDAGATSQGVIALSLDLAWDNGSLVFQGADNLTIPTGNDTLPLADRLVTANFPLQRAVEGYDPAAGPIDPSAAAPIDTFSLRCVRGGALPQLSSDTFVGGSAIGVGTAEAFSQLKFVAGATQAATTFTAHLDGSMSFADAAILDGVVPRGNAVDVPELANTVARTLQVVGGSISGVKFDDLNGNGVRDTGEPAKPGIGIRLSPVSPTGPATEVVTDANGMYSFDDLAAGSYAVSEVVSPGEIVTLPTNNRYDVMLNQQTQSMSNLDFGDFTLVSLSGTKFNVANSVETAAGGVTIRLDIGNDNDVSNDPPDQVTDSDGNYSFENVGPGTHAIIEQVPAGFQPLTPASGRYVVTPISGQDQTSLDFRNQQIVPTGTISGIKFDDINGDGTHQPTEPGRPGVTIQLDLGNDGSFERIVTTDASGVFTFSDVPVGTHLVREVVPAGSVPTTPQLPPVTVIADQVISGLLIGNFQLTTLSGNAFTDVNANAAKDTSELGRPNEIVSLDLNNDGTIDATTTTDATGNYQFADIGPGTHSISIQVPAGFSLTLPTPQPYVIPNRSGVSLSNLDFGLNQILPTSSSISGVVYNDVNRDGLVGPDEVGLPGVTVQLFRGTDATPNQVQTTAIDGSYRFTNLTPGTYRIIELQPTRFRDASIQLGTVLPSGETRGNASGLNAFDGVVIGEGETAIDYNFGEIIAAATKRMVLSNTDVRSEMASNLNVESQLLRGTLGDDVILVEHLSDGRVQVTINGARPVLVTSSNVQTLIIDALGGNDSVTFVGSEANESYRVGPNQAVLVSNELSVGVFNATHIQISGGGGTDVAVFRDSTASDTLAATGNRVTLSTASGSSIELSGIGTVDAVSVVDNAPDTANVDAIDFVLRLAGDWNSA